MIKKIIYLSLTILWMVIIFLFSSQKGELSSSNSRGFIDKTIIVVYKIFNKNVSLEKEEKIIDTFEMPIRKVAHFFEYFILGLLVYLTLNEFGIKSKYLMLFVCFLYASCDEIHQLFVAGRSGQFIDVLLDSFGSFVSIFLISYFKSLIK